MRDNQAGAASAVLAAAAAAMAALAATAAAAAGAAAGAEVGAETGKVVEARTAKRGSISQRPNGLECRETRGGAG